MLGTVYINDNLKQAAAKAYGVSQEEPINETSIWDAIRSNIAKRIESSYKELATQSTVVEENDVTISGA